MKAFGVMEVKFYTVFNLSPVQRSASRSGRLALCETDIGTLWVGGWGAHIAGPEVAAERKISSLA
jgi:hypothetical protein